MITHPNPPSRFLPPSGEMAAAGAGIVDSILKET